MANVRKKVSVVQIIRVCIQILALIFFPGIFILTFDGIKEIFMSIFAGNFNFLHELPRMAEVIAIVPITIILGRFFCGWLCAFGAFNDFVYIIASKVFKIKFKINEKWDSALKYVKYIILAVAVYLIWISGSTIFEGTSPWDAFAQLPNIKDAVTQYTIGFILLVGITIGAVLIERFFCRYLCPLGAIFAIISKIRIFNISKPTDKCGKCRICTSKCAMGIQLYKHDEVRSGECINCFKCVEACPRKNPKAAILDEEINHVAAAGAAIVVVGGLYAATNFAGKMLTPTGANYSVKASQYASAPNSSNNKFNTPSSDDNNGLSGGSSDNSSSNNGVTGNSNDNSTNNNGIIGSSNGTPAAGQNNTPSSSQQQYKDGTYTGTGRGYRPGLQVAVTIKGGKITDVEIVSSNETPRFSRYAFQTVPGEIVQAQSADVDTVSGATRSSIGIIQAVEDALSQAKN